MKTHTLDPQTGILGTLNNLPCINAQETTEPQGITISGTTFQHWRVSETEEPSQQQVLRTILQSVVNPKPL